MRAVVFILVLFMVKVAGAVSELPNPQIQKSPTSVPLGDLQPTGDDRVAPDPVSLRDLPSFFANRDQFSASIKAKLEEDDMRLDTLRLDGPENSGPQLAKIEEELQNLHTVINNLNSVSDDDLKSLEKRVANNFTNIDGRLSKIENQPK
jgi:hypothetical protein